MAYTRLDKISATAHIESIVADVDLVNGQHVVLGELQEDGEARKVTVYEEGGDKTKVVFHSSVPLTYEDRTNELDFVLKAGKIGRSYVYENGNIVSVTKDLIQGEAKKNALVDIAGEGFKVVGEEETVEGLHGEIIDIDYDAIAGELAVIRIYA